MKDNKAEDIIRVKIREQESEPGLPEAQAALWARLDERLDEKPVPPRKPYPTWLAAASVVFLLVLTYCLYPAHKSGSVQGTAAVQPPVISNPVGPAVQEQETTAPEPLIQHNAATARVKKVKMLKQEEPEKEKHDDPAADYAGLYAMPQIACAEVAADHYPLCSQTL